jgi:UDP-glucose 4-epimerase
MRIAVTGATGNLGLALVSALSREPTVDDIVGIARRRPFLEIDKVRWVTADVAGDDLVPLLDGADIVVHLAWMLQPSHNAELLWRVNVGGSRRVFRAAGRAGARALVHASSVGAYARRRSDDPVDESWPTTGVGTSTYSRQKAYVERVLDAFANAAPEVRVVRLRPGFALQRAAANQIRRLFLGPLFPGVLVRRRFLAALPRLSGLRFQTVHSADVAEGFVLAALGDVHGAFNLAAEPVLDPPELARLLDAHLVPAATAPLRALADLTYRLGLQPTEPGWLDLLLSVPVMDVTRARAELGWVPTRSAGEALVELLDGIRDGAAHGTPPLQGAPLPEPQDRVPLT